VAQPVMLKAEENLAASKSLWRGIYQWDSGVRASLRISANWQMQLKVSVLYQSVTRDELITLNLFK